MVTVEVNRILHFHFFHPYQHIFLRNSQLNPIDYLNQIEHMKLVVLIVRSIREHEHDQLRDQRIFHIQNLLDVNDEIQYEQH